jgi:hypothetical protein
MRTILLLAIVITSAVGCGSPQRPVTFVSSAKMDGGLDTVSRTLAAEGHGSAALDRQAGIAHTEWKDTGFLFGQVQGTSASIVRRFTIILSPSASGSNVTVRMDAKRCAQGGFTIEGADVRGPCEELGVIPESFQQEVDTLGGKIQQALAAK